MYSEVNGPERSYNDQFYISIYMWHCTIGLTAYLQQLIYNFLQSPTLYWVSTDPGQNSVLHVKVTTCAGWFPKVLSC